MSSATHVGVDAAVGAYPTDEQILGIDPPSPEGGFGGLAREDGAGGFSRGESALAELKASVADGGVDPADSLRAGDLRDGNSLAADGMPVWMQTLAGDPAHSAEARALWSEHQAFRAAFSSPKEARAIKELFPGGAPEAQGLNNRRSRWSGLTRRFFGDVRAQSEVVAEIARANPAAFRSLFTEAAKVLAGMGVNVAPGAQGSASFQAGDTLSTAPTLRENREGWGTQNLNTNHPPSPESGFGGLRRRIRRHQSRDCSHESLVTRLRLTTASAGFASRRSSTPPLTPRSSALPTTLWRGMCARRSVTRSLACCLKVLLKALRGGLARIFLVRYIAHWLPIALSPSRWGRRCVLRWHWGRAGDLGRRSSSGGVAARGTRAADHAQRGSARDWRVD